MKKTIFQKWWFWVIVVVLALGAIGNLTDDDTTSDPNETTQTETNVSSSISNQDEEGSQSNPYTLDADLWYSNHRSGTLTQKYMDRWVKVSGTVLSISDYGSLKGYYLSGGPGCGLVCWADETSLSVQYGQQITYIGKVSVEDSKHIEITDGELVSVSWPTTKSKSPITITDWAWTSDYLGGVEWNFKITNNTNETVKYVTMEWDCYNAVGDLVRDEITGKSSYSIKYTGPLNSTQSTDLLRNTTLFYNSSYYTSKLTKLIVEFTDGTIIYINDECYTDILIIN